MTVSGEGVRSPGSERLLTPFRMRRFRFPLCFSPALLYFSVVLETQTAPFLFDNKYLPPRANFTPREVADFLGCGVTTVYEQINQGCYPAFKLPGCGTGEKGAWRVPRNPFLDWYSQNHNSNQTSPH